MNRESAIWTAIVVAFLLLAMSFTLQAAAQDKVAYCKNAQDGSVIVIEANMACPMGYYRI